MVGIHLEFKIHQPRKKKMKTKSIKDGVWGRNAKDDIFAIRCFLNRRRKFTHELTKKEAKCFRATALYLASYLKKEYELKD